MSDGDDAHEHPPDVDCERIPDALGVDSGVPPENLLDVEQWLTWKHTDDDPPRKVPRAPYANAGDPDEYVSAQDPDVWTDAVTAREWADKLPGHEPAFNIRNRGEYPDERLVLIDYDDVRDPASGRVHPTVREHLARAASYADVSQADTGVHILVFGALPDGVKAIDAALPEHPDFLDAEIEVYDSARFTAMTGRHLARTPRCVADAQAFLDHLVDEYATVADGTPDALTREPRKTAAELATVETTTDMGDVFDAIQHVGPDDIALRSPVTEERADGTRSRDPTWTRSKSGTRLAELRDGWVSRKGMHGLDALQVVALEEGILTRPDEYPQGDAFRDAVDALRERGAHIPEYDPVDGKHVPLLPDVAGWDWRGAARQHTRKTEADALTMADARERTRQAIAAAYRSGGNTLVEALPTLGKSYGMFAAAADTSIPILALTGRGHVEQYGQYREWCDEQDLTYYTLPSFTHDCPTANGEHGDEWRERVRAWYRRGATGQDIHRDAVSVLGDPLPCQRDGTCAYSAKWRFDPDDYDVLIGHYTHAHVPKVNTRRVVVCDEFTNDYEIRLAGDALARAITQFLQSVDALPFEDYTGLVEHRHAPKRRADALAWFEDRGIDPDPAQAFDGAHGHTYAPLAVYTLLVAASDNEQGRNLGNGWEYARLDGSRIGVFDRENGAVHLLVPPVLDYARGVVALDGTPTRELWELVLGRRLTHRQVLTDAERCEYVRDTLGLRIVQTSDAIKPYNNDDYVNVRQDAALLAAIHDHHERKADLITSRTALGSDNGSGVYETTAADVDVLGQVDQSEHRGNVRGSNQFKHSRLGAVIGSQHYGDCYVKKWGAFAGKAVDSPDRSDAANRGAGLSYGEFGDKILHHMREHVTLQETMRFGRDGNGAVVYVHTAALPDWVPLADEGRVVTTWSDGMRQVLAAARDRREWTTTDLADHSAVDIGVRQVFNHLETLVERGHLQRTPNPDDRRGYVWRDDGLHNVNDHGAVDLTHVDLAPCADAEVAEVARTGTYTWEFRKFTRAAAGRNSGDGQPPTAAGRPPPHDSESDSSPVD